jgi:putative transport protein
MSRFLAKNTRSAGKERYDVVISALTARASSWLPARKPACSLAIFSIWLGGLLDRCRGGYGGQRPAKLQQVQMLPVFIGIGLGVLLGSIPLYVPGFPVALAGAGGRAADYGADPRAYRLYR